MKECKVCSCGTVAVARGMCKKCYDKWRLQNLHLMKPRKKKPKDLSAYPKPHVITVWECSDGREFSNEVEACRYELDLFRRG